MAIAQIPMHWTIEENVDSMLSAMEVAHSMGATVCAFSELAITGFHRNIVSLAHPNLVTPAINRVLALAARLRQAVAFGAPTFGDGGVRYNSHLLANERGEVFTVHKNGLTAPEATFFQPGSQRPTTLLQGIRSTAVICREIEDHGPVLDQLAEQPAELILWPGLMGPDRSKPLTDPPGHVVQAQALAVAAGAYVVQTNWPNALNRPEESVNTGQSACIAPSGELLFRLPEQGFGVGVFILGESSFEWHAQ